MRTNWFCTPFMSFIQVWTRENWGEGKKKEDGWEWREEFWRRVKSIMSSLQRIICPITGGASGLGRATAQRLIRNGARVVITDLPTSDGDNVAKELGENSCYFSPTDQLVRRSTYTKAVQFCFGQSFFL